MQDVLNQHRDANVQVFAVWEPILFTDWRKPGASVLARLPDSRVMQIWDPHHLLAKQLAKDVRPPQPEPECCTRNHILWDLVAVYPPDAAWVEAVPQAALFDGPVVDKRSQIEATLLKLQKR